MIMLFCLLVGYGTAEYEFLKKCGAKYYYGYCELFFVILQQETDTVGAPAKTNRTGIVTVVT